MKLIAVFSVIFVLLPSICFGQLDKKPYTKSLKVSTILRTGKIEYFGIIDMSRDSIECLYLNGFYWFIFPYKTIGNDHYGKLYAYSGKGDSVKLISNMPLGISDYHSSIYDLYIFNDNLFYLSRFDTDIDNGIVGNDRIDLIDQTNLSIKWEIDLEHNTWRKNVYSKGDSLFIEVRPVKAEPDIMYYVLFWMPRGRPTKYRYIYGEEVIQYIFDKQINLLRKRKFPAAKEI